VHANGSQVHGCDVFDDIFSAIFKINACFDIYQVGQLCPIPWDVLGIPFSAFYLPVGFDQVYFNRTDVKEVIHAPLDSDWVICSEQPVFVNDTDLSLPSGLTGGPLQRVIEKTNNVIVGHGALDMVLILNGSLLILQNLTWNGAQGFSQPPVQPFYVPYAADAVAGSIAGAGIFGGWVTERGLTFCSVDMSGHEIPEYQPSAAYRHVEFLLGRIANLSEVSGFTTQPKYPQSQQPLGLGNGPY
jgi:carboxypeptidase D